MKNTHASDHMPSVDRDGLKSAMTASWFMKCSNFVMVISECGIGVVLVLFVCVRVPLTLCFAVLVPGSSDEDFAAALYHFNHSLVTSDLPSPALQVRGRARPALE